MAVGRYQHAHAASTYSYTLALSRSPSPSPLPCSFLQPSYPHVLSPLHVPFLPSSHVFPFFPLQPFAPRLLYCLRSLSPSLFFCLLHPLLSPVFSNITFFPLLSISLLILASPIFLLLRIYYFSDFLSLSFSLHVLSLSL